MRGVKANSGIWMDNTRLRNPSIGQLLHPRPREVPFATPMNHRGPPEPDHPVAECEQAVDVTPYCVVVEVTLDDRSKPSAVLRRRFMHTLA